MSIYLAKVAYINLYLQKYIYIDEPTTNPPLLPYIEDLNCGWVGTGNGVWTYENPTNSYSDIYQVLKGHKYFLTLGDTVGTRFRVMFSTLDVSKVTGKVNGIAVNRSDYNNPAPHQNLWYTPDDNGYIIIQKDNVGSSGIKTYLYDATVPQKICCFPLCSVDTDTSDNSKIMLIVQALLPCLSKDFLFVAVKKIKGYKILVL